MWGRLKTCCAAGLLVGGFAACSGVDLAHLQTLPLRATPQEPLPYTEAAPGDPLRGTAVAVDLAVDA